jgi:hypothetical protein
MDQASTGFGNSLYLAAWNLPGGSPGVRTLSQRLGPKTAETMGLFRLQGRRVAPGGSA